MKVRRSEFLAAALALGATMGCDATAAIVSRISPEKPEGVAPAPQAQAAESDPLARRGDPDEEGMRANAARNTGSLPAPTKEFGPSPTKEAGMPSPTKEWMPSPTKEAGMPSPTKEAGMPSPTKER